MEGESLGILTHAATPEIKEIIAGSPAAQAGINPKAQRSCPLSKKKLFLIEDIPNRFCTALFKNLQKFVANIDLFEPSTFLGCYLVLTFTYV